MQDLSEGIIISNPSSFDSVLDIRFKNKSIQKLQNIIKTESSLNDTDIENTT